MLSVKHHNRDTLQTGPLVSAAEVLYCFKNKAVKTHKIQKQYGQHFQNYKNKIEPVLLDFQNKNFYP